METIEWHDLSDRTAWPSGPWDGEPDKAQWPDEATGLPCLIVRNRMGGLCGYVGVPSGHPWHGKHYDDVTPYPDVHGGLTFSDRCQPENGRGEARVCHTPAEGEPDDVWWLGFDCLHYQDAYPSQSEYGYVSSEEVYRTIGYVREQVTGLAAQAAEAVSS